MSEWKEIRLGDSIETNKRAITKTYPFDTILYLDTGSITCNKISGLQEFNLSEAPSRAKRLVKDDDIIYSSVRPNQLHYGYIIEPAQNLVVSTGFVVISCLNDINSKFLYYNLSQKSTTEYLHSIAEGSTSAYPSLKPSDIENLDILLPPITEQEQIAEVLSSLDDKINLLHRQNETLEAMAETLFRQWFIEQAEDDWDTEPLESIIDFNPRYKLSKGMDATYLEMSNVSETIFHPKDWYNRTFASGTKFMNGDTLLARITPCLENGKTCFVYFLNDEEVGWGSTEYIVMRMKPGYHPFLSYIIAKNEEFRDFAESSMTGSSGRQRAQADVIKTFEIQIPPKLIIENLNKQVDSIFNKLKNNATQIKSLESLRNTLLPKLMSGEIQVKTKHINHGFTK